MPPCRRQVEIDIQLDGLPEKVHSGVLGDNSAATAKWRWTCSHVADAAPEWPALLAATTTATLILRADPSYPTVALFHVSLTLRKILKRRGLQQSHRRVGPRASSCPVPFSHIHRPYTHNWPH